MTLWSRFHSWVRAALGRSRMESDMNTELRFDIEACAEDLVRKGLPRQEAMRRARMEFGGIERAKEECREARRVSFLESLTQDVRFGLRMLCKSPGFTAVAVLTFTLGIGANTAIFTVAYNVLLRPLPYRDASCLVMVWEDSSAYGFPQDTPAPGNFASWKSQNNVFADMAALRGGDFDLTGAGNPEQFRGVEITANIFPLLGVKPALGRNISPEEDKPGTNHVVILRHAV
jgi:MacB-like periplasmic core domain